MDSYTETPVSADQQKLTFISSVQTRGTAERTYQIQIAYSGKKEPKRNPCCLHTLMMMKQCCDKYYLPPKKRGEKFFKKQHHLPGNIS